MIRLFLFALLTLGLLVPAQAADISAVTAGYLPYDEIRKGKCTIELSGVIKKGDSERLRKVLSDRFDPSKLETHADVLCLDSPGGSLDEAITLVDMIWRSKVTTMVPSGKTCLSACAVAFMGGVRMEGDERRNARYMFADSRIGFHAPMLEVPEGSYEKATVQKAFDVAVQSMGRIASELSYSEMAETTAKFPYSLMAEMLTHVGQDFMYINYVEQAGVWDIDVLGLWSAEPNHRNLNMLCHSASRWLADDPQPVWRKGMTGELVRNPAMGEFTKVGDGIWQIELPKDAFFKGMWSTLCNIKSDGQGGYLVQVEQSDITIGQAEYGGWAAFAGDTSLKFISD